MNTGGIRSQARFSYSPLGPLATALVKTAQQASRNLKTSQAKGLQYGEVTITETSLVMLMRAIKELRVSTKVDNKPESKTGADYEFWIEGHQKWFSFVVQAKKMKLDAQTRAGEGIITYDVGYEVGKAKKPQIEILLKNTKPAVYALYNPPGMGSSRGFDQTLDHDRYVSQICAPVVTSHMDGITVVPAKAMKAAYEATRQQAEKWNSELKERRKKERRKKDTPQHGIVNLTKVATLHTTPIAFPWSCLAACPRDSWCRKLVGTEGDLRTDQFDPRVDVKNDPAYLIANSMYRLFKRASMPPGSDSVPWPSSFGNLHEEIETGILTKAEVPHYVVSLREGRERVHIQEEPAGSTADYIVTLFLDREAEVRPPR